MAQKATIYKVELSVSDMDRHYYETHNLTVAKHPSETDERLMVRILAFALNAHEKLEFSRGISTDDEPDIWQKSLSGELELWVSWAFQAKRLCVNPVAKLKRWSSIATAAGRLRCGGKKSKTKLPALTTFRLLTFLRRTPVNWLCRQVVLCGCKSIFRRVM